MEGVDTVDVSWLHHTQKDLVRSKSAPSKIAQNVAVNSSSPNVNDTNATPQRNSENINALAEASLGPLNSKPLPIPSQQSPKQNVPIEAASAPAPLSSGPVQSQNSNSKPSAARPIPTTRRNSWISSLSSKFSSGSTPPAQNHMKDVGSNSKLQPQNTTRIEANNPFGASFSPKDSDKKDDFLHPPTGSSPKSGHPSFFHNALRKLSSSSSNGMSKLVPSGTVCPRRVMNVNSERDRCKVPELDPSKLRRVAFSVDVEIAGTTRRSDSDDDKNTGKPLPGLDQKKSSKTDDPKSMEASEGETLKAAQSASSASPVNETTDGTGEDASKTQAKEMTKKQEKKKKSEEERKERKEKKRRQAEENGTVPLQFNLEGSSSKTRSPHRSQRGQDQPTTDPVRIYRRCCQLRETGVLKKLVEQISAPSSTLSESPGTVAVLDLTGFCMSLQDLITFSDWLAIVPVRKLILQNCGLTDESIRVILGGLLATKTIEAARTARRLKQKSNGAEVQKDEKYGAIEKLSLKGNFKIGPEGWRHISLFIHMSRSLKGIDLSGIPFPRPTPPTNSPVSPTKQTSPITDISTIFANALARRFGGRRLEELVLSECSPTTEDIEKICDAARTVGLRRLGLANNNLTKDGFEHVIRYFKAGQCEGLDLGGNDLKDHIGLLASAIEKTFPFSALSLADCSLTPKNMCPLLQSLATLPSFRFIDLSHNQELFSTQPNSLAALRRYVPQMPDLRRIHLADVCLTSSHAIALAEILPDCPKLCHINILENPAIQALAAASTATAQEEACALYASFMSAARISRTLIAVDIDVPAPENNEVVKALAAQIVAYSLQNLERGGDLGIDISSSPDAVTLEKDLVPVPEILAHLVGHVDDTDEDIDDEQLAAGEDYVIGGTGVVKALGICLGNTDYSAVEPGVDQSPMASGASTPLRRLSHVPVSKKPRDMSRDLLNSARKIRTRLQPALIREDKAGNDLNYRRLQFLDFTLHRMIERFEDEFPDTRLPSATQPARSGDSSPEPPTISDSATLEASGSITHPDPDADAATIGDDDDTDRYAVRLSRTSSNTSLHSRALTSEEGRVHRLGQHLSRDFLSSDLDNPEEPISQSPPDEAHISILRGKLERLRGSEGQLHIESVGADKALEELGSSIEDLLALQKHDPDLFAEFKESQIVALINAGLRNQDE